MSRRADPDSRPKRKRSNKPSTARLAPERRDSRNRPKKAGRARVSSGESQEMRLAKFLRGQFFNRQGPSDVIIVIAGRRPMIASQTDKLWQVEKFIADYENVLIDGKGIPEDLYEAIKSSLEGQEQQPSMAESAEKVLDGLSRAAPKVKSLLEMFGVGAKKGSETT